MSMDSIQNKDFTYKKLADEAYKISSKYHVQYTKCL